MMVRAPILIPHDDGRVELIADGLIVGESTIQWIGSFADFPKESKMSARRIDGVICPPFFDNHIHIPQHPIRGKFTDGVGENPEGGRLLAGLNRNVFPTEAHCHDPKYTRDLVDAFRRDTLAKGVIGGAAYMTVHASATRIALEQLADSWSVGLVMMNQNCPPYLRTNEHSFNEDAESLAREFGRRYIVTDRFAVACNISLRQRGVAIAERFGLRMQTHLNEQLAEKAFVEKHLHPASSYTDVYAHDGLLRTGGAIMAHCIHNMPAELETLASNRAVIAHCPVSNTLLGSGIMPLDAIVDHGIDWALCTDVGASPTTSLLNEMAHFLKVHAGRSKRATPSEALYRCTLGAARMLGQDHRAGRLATGQPMTFIEVNASRLPAAGATSDEVIRSLLDVGSPLDREALDLLAAGGLDVCPHFHHLCDDVNRTARQLEDRVSRVTVDGMVRFERAG